MKAPPVEQPSAQPEEKKEQAVPAEQPVMDERVFSFNNQGIALLEQYKYTEAREAFARASALAPEFLPARINLAIALYYGVGRDQALKELKALSNVAPRSPTVNFLMGLILREQDHIDEAIARFREVLTVDPRDVATNYHLGALWARKGQYDQAVASYTKALQAEPYNASVRYGLAIALIRGGKTDEGQKAMEKFQELEKKDYASRLGTQYGQQGRYAEAVTGAAAMAGSFAQSEPTPVTFTDVARAVGITFTHGGGAPKSAGIFNRRLKAEQYSVELAEQELVCGFGSGAAFFDFDNDGKLDLYLVNCSPNGEAANALYRNVGGRFVEVTEKAGVGLSGFGMGVAVGDYDNDGFADLYLTNYGRNTLLHNNGDGTFSDVTNAAGVGGGERAWSLGATFVDFDHDGDLDLYVTNFVDLIRPPAAKEGSFVFPDDFPGQPNLLYRNNGDGAFTEVGQAANLSLGASKSAGAVSTDYNNSRDVDFYVVNYGGADKLVSNNRDGTFRDVTRSVGLASEGHKLGVAIADFNKDGSPDVYVPRIYASDLLFRSKGDGTFARGSVEAVGSQTSGGSEKRIGWAAQFVDYDNDGYLDVFVINGASRASEAEANRLQLLRNLGDGTFKDISNEVRFDALPSSFARGAAFGDYDGDGDVDALIVQNGGRPLLLKNTGGNKNHWVKVKTTGVRNNKLGIGTKVEVMAGSLWQKIEVQGGAGYLSQSSTDVVFGLGKRKKAEAIRLLWPTGVLQAELDLAVNRKVEIKELDRKGTSCPILYAWNGERYEFVTDFLGGSAIGYLLAPGVYNTPDTDEYIKVRSDQLKEKDGVYSIKMNDQLEEVIMIDQVKLLAIDHPAEVDLFPNERLMPSPPYPEFKIYAVENARPPVSAFDLHGDNLLPLIEEVDRQSPSDFRLLPFKGYAEQHAITLDLGDVPADLAVSARREPRERILLLLTAWINYADSTSNLAASQAGVKLIPPYLQVPDESGRWVTVIPSMGFPAGLPKTMVVDLTGKFLSPDYRVRIVTSMRIYWDQILVAASAEVADGADRVRTAELKPMNASLQWRGYPREYSPDGRLPLIYDYSTIEPQAPWKTFVGEATRYGEVTELLLEKDEMYVIMLHGDEITIEFDARSVPPVPPGWKRDFFVYADGFGKDMDVNSARPDTIEPLPFHRMSSYPYPRSENYPTDQRHQEYRKRYNTRRYQDPIEETDLPKARRRGGMR